MSSNSGRFLRDNLFLIAAVALPVVIVALFLVVSAVPRWLVPPPGYDLLLRTSAFDQTSPGVAVEFVVQNERVRATVRAVPANSYPQRSTLWLFDHATMNVREVPMELPQLAPGESARTVPVEVLAARRVVTQTKAPDGYELQNRSHRGSGLIGDLFGMNRYDQAVSLVNKGRIIPLRISSPHHHQSPLFVGWLIDEGTH